MNHIDRYLEDAVKIIGALDRQKIQRLVEMLVDLKEREGRCHQGAREKDGEGGMGGRDGGGGMRRRQRDTHKWPGL